MIIDKNGYFYRVSTVYADFNKELKHFSICDILPKFLQGIFIIFCIIGVVGFCLGCIISFALCYSMLGELDPIYWSAVMGSAICFIMFVIILICALVFFVSFGNEFYACNKPYSLIQKVSDWKKILSGKLCIKVELK